MILRLHFTKRLMSFFLFSAFLSLSHFSLLAQEWERTYPSPFGSLDPGEGSYIQETSDGGFIIAAINHFWSSDADTSIVIIKTDAQGEEEWSTNIPVNDYVNDLRPSVVETSFGYFNVAGEIRTYDLATDLFDTDGLLAQLDPDGNITWQITAGGDGYDAFKEILLLDNDDIIVVGSTGGSFPGFTAFDIWVARYNPGGFPMWSNIYGGNDFQRGFSVALADDGNLIIAGEDQPGAGLIVIKIDLDGNLIWDQRYPIEHDIKEPDVQVDSEGNIYTVADIPLSPNGSYIQKTDPQGDLIWSNTVGDNIVLDARALQILPDGHLRVAGVYANPGFSFGTVFVLDELGNLLSSEQFPISIPGAEPYNGLHHITPTSDGSFAATGAIGEIIYAVKYGNSFNTLSGNVFHDLNEDCLWDDASEDGLQNWILEVYDGTQTTYGYTNTNGEYQIALSSGDYELTLTPPSTYWEGCQDSYLFNFTGSGENLNLDIPFQSGESCPYMEVNIGLSNNHRICETSRYFVNWCNWGDAIGEDAYLEVTLDPNLTYISSSVTPTAQDGNLLTFALGDVAIGECGQIWIDAVLACDTDILGFTHCSVAYMYPDTICGDTSQWSGAEVILEGTCIDGEIQFTIRNIGDAPTTPPLNYIVIEDEVIYMESNFGLNPSQEFSLPLITGDGSTYRLQAEQEPGFPGFSMPSVTVEGCTADNTATISTGFVNSFPLDDEDHFTDEHCEENVFPYDPNNKTAEPEGYGEEHFIERNIQLEYILRFQNLGTAPAFDVVIRDTLSEHFDISSIRPGVASHDYTFHLEGTGVAVFTFESINLPDSTSNPEASQGFVTFSIRQNEDLPLGTIIENDAAIYFDFNEPIFTNTTFHTIGSNFITVDVIDIPQNESIKITTAPNPFSESARISIEGMSIEEGAITIYDTMGKLIRTDYFSSNSIDLQRLGLSAGTYYFLIQTDGKYIGKGRLLIL